jgi:nitrate/nitrite transporter NarK
MSTLLLLRFATGLVLAGIYPVGMKIAAGWFAQGLGWALGVLVGALVLGTALPFALRAVGAHWPWQGVMLAVAACAAAGGVLMAGLVPDGPYLAPAQRIAPRALGVIWTDRRVRASAFGYFGHMWELYALLVLVPAIVATRFSGAAASWWTFFAIGAGGVACVLGGLLARRAGGARVAAVQLAASGACALAAPWLLDAPLVWWALWLTVWGGTVAGDSPQFSALTAANAPRAAVGSVLTFVNAIGLSISVATIALFVALATRWPLAWVLSGLAIGPIVGLWFLRPLLARS